MKRSVRLRLHDILEAIEVSRRRWPRPEDLKAQDPRIYWQEIAAIGNLLRHEYGRIDDRIMWRVVQKYLPELKSVVLDMQRQFGSRK